MIVLPTDVKRGSRIASLPEIAPLALIKKALTVETDDDDELIQSYMDSAKVYIEEFIDRPLDSYVWTMTWPAVNSGDELLIVHSPVTSVESKDRDEIKTITRDGFISYLEWDTVAPYANIGKLTLAVTTAWDEHLDKIRHPYLTIVGEMYRQREMSAPKKSVQNVVMQALSVLTRRISPYA